MSDPLAQLINTPLRPQPRVPERCEQLTDARALEPEGYWEWVAEQHRWSTRWTAVRTGGITDTRWFDALFRAASAICFTIGRVKFVSPRGEFAAPAMGQAFTYFGPHLSRFTEVFSEVGNVVTPANDNAATIEAAA